MMRVWLIWGILVACLTVPVIVAIFSPVLAWRDPVYIAAGFAGILALVLLPIQPLAAKGVLPKITPLTGRRIHRAIGALLVSAVIVHVVGLWITSPPDVNDALLLRSPTPFAVWGVLAMWAVFASALLAILRAKGILRWRTWRAIHVPLAFIIVAGTIVHAVLIEGAMGQGSKVAVCIVAAFATAWVFIKPHLPRS